MTKELLQQALAALESIAFAGMSPSPEMSQNGVEEWHARQAWRFIGIAARAVEALRAAIAQPVQGDTKDAERPMELPGLPHSFAYIFEWSDGTQKLSSNSRNGVAYTSSYVVYTADQVRKIQRDAIDAAIASQKGAA